jgi:hypothetical protein
MTGKSRTHRADVTKKEGRAIKIAGTVQMDFDKGSWEKVE